jgi:hypothetical protein
VTGFNVEQTAQLLKPIAPQRVLRDGKGHSHVSQQDVRAHLIRIFGFGGWETQVLDLVCVSERERRNDTNLITGWDVVYRCLIRLSVKDTSGDVVAAYEDAATGQGANQKTLADAHDLACKSAVSYALKRAATCLGDQFGLSLYNKGQTLALVVGTLVGGAESSGNDLQKAVPQQVSLGNVEGGDDPQDAPAQPVADQGSPIVLRAQIAAWARDKAVGVADVEAAFVKEWPDVTIRTASGKILGEFLSQLRNGEVSVGA